MMHVAHLRHALSILDDATVKQRIVYDSSRLRATRIHVVWLSPNDWTNAGGSRYGNVEFSFEWRALIEGKNYYWIGAMADYAPVACRILITSEDRSGLYVRYDPNQGNGPWWYEEAANTHWWNGNICLEILLESNLAISTAQGMGFTKHNQRRCNIEKGGGCRDSNRTPSQAGPDLISGWAAGSLAGRPFPETCRPGIVKAWSDIVTPLARLEGGAWGTVDDGDPLAPMLARAALSSYARRDRGERDAIARRFRSSAAAVRALKAIVTTTFSVAAVDLDAALDPDLETALVMSEL
ncbi:MAG TPA: hypothetical protein VGI39_30645 [Polyangiaceae bacterium]